MDVLTGIAALSQAINIAKFIRETEKDLQGAEIKSRMVELYEKLSDAKMALVDARDDLRSKDEEIAELKKRFKFREATVKHQGFRYEADAEGKPIGFAFCPRCEEVDGAMIRLTTVLGVVTCPGCKAHFDRVQVFQYPS